MPLGLLVWNSFGSIKFGQSGFDLGKEQEPFNGIVDGGVWRHCLERLDDAIAGKWLLHNLIVMHVSRQAKVSERDANPEVSRPAVSKFENRLLRPTNLLSPSFYGLAAIPIIHY